MVGEARETISFSMTRAFLLFALYEISTKSPMMGMSPNAKSMMIFPSNLTWTKSGKPPSICSAVLYNISDRPKEAKSPTLYKLLAYNIRIRSHLCRNSHGNHSDDTAPSYPIPQHIEQHIQVVRSSRNLS